ncbi:DNA repair exonuclease [Paenibacillus sp. GSMTC-2017]|uniref:metallophosphoesterase family protein n=1 Tax=Paenibacillus sp. GSMTC-2017 TaxID=2794350 RepID=UPI0018D6120E|nr:DNA repair exonuclease [Paenibacillus sp. GSMTC-2017]MBH5317005.1 DNA repair exonuclease [Paenibacillus sp. GSMTC-2017]
MSMPFRFIHAADIHLDSPFRGLTKVPEVVRAELTDATFAALKRLTDTAIAEKVDFIVIAGDLFDEADRSLRAQLAFLKEWERLADNGITVFAIHGNHDHLGGKRAKLTLPSNVHIFGAEEMSYRPAFHRNGELVAYIYGMSYGERAVASNIAATYQTAPEAPYHIALLHANVGGDSGHDPYAPCTLEELARSGFDYWALGHIHKRQVLSEYPHVVYAGNTQGRNPKETGAKGCYIVDVIDSRNTNAKFTTLDSIRWLEEDVSIEGLATEQQLLQLLSHQIGVKLDEEDGCSIMLRVRLKGRGPLHDHIRSAYVCATILEQLQSEYEPTQGMPWIYVYELVAETGAELDWEALSVEDSFAGELLRLCNRLEENKEDWRSFAQSALQDISSHPKLGRIGRSKWDKPSNHWLEQAKELTLSLVAENRVDNNRS